MRKNLLIMLIFGFSFSLMASGCKDKASCKLLYKRYKKCKEKEVKSLKEKTFVALCKGFKDDKNMGDEIKGEIQCSLKSDCDEFKKCIKANKVKFKGEKAAKKINKYIKNGKMKKAISECKWSKDYLSDATKKVCSGLKQKYFDSLTKKVTELRDKGGKYDYGACYDIKDIGKKLGKKQEKAAETLCKELRLAVTLKEAKASMAKSMKKKKYYTPYQCSKSTFKKFDKLGTPFAKKAKAELMKECYVNFGAYVLKDKLPVAKAKKFCIYEVDSIYKKIKEYKIKDAKIDAFVKEAEAICKK